MSEIGCKKCGSPDCRGCNMFILSNALRSGVFTPVMNETRSIDIDALKEKIAERKTGKWIDGHSTCSICKWYPTNRYGFVVRADYNYCPNCGVEMEDSIWRQTNDRR